ncbi:MAG: MBL fold metallo-hydrolase, partial [Sphingomicrobium sp.]
MSPTIHAFFNEPTNTVSYLIADPVSGAAAVVDPVLDYDAEDGTVDTASAEAILAKAAELGWRIELVLET